METPQQEKLLAKVDHLEQENLILRQQLAHVLKQLYGSKSEKLDASQLALFEEEGKPETSAETETEATKDGSNRKNSKSRPRREARLPDNLPTRSETIIPDEVLADPDQWRCMGEDVSTRLELEPGYMYLLKTIRPKYVLVDNPFQPPVQEPAPPSLIPGGFLGNGLLSEIITNRYLYALPFYRQEQLFSQRYHIELARSTMSDATANAARALEPLCKIIKKEMLKTGYIGSDETPVKYLDPKTRGSQQGYYWVYRNANGEVLFEWKTNRRHHHLADFLGDDYKGIIQSDGYEAYQKYSSNHEGVQRASCMAHIRRKFVDALDGSPEVVNWLIRIIGRLYALEAMLREYEADAETRARVRRSHSAPILKLLHKAVKHLQSKSRILSKSNLGKALSYAIGQLPAMYVYLEHGEVEIDNNLVENAIRPTAVGKKNHLFIGSPEAGDKSAVLYSLLLSAKACGVPPQQYLRDVMERLPRIETWDEEALLELTPARWAEVWHAQQKALEESTDVA